MLDRKFRLTKDKDFDNVYKSGSSFFSRILGIKYTKNSLEVTRFGIIIGSKISKKSTERNKVKRRIREILRLNLKNIKKGYDIVVLVRSSIIECDYGEIQKNLSYVLTKSNLINKE